MCFAPQRRALFRHVFDIWTSKSGPSMWCFVHFDLEMCFAPQRRALFRHLNFQKWSDPLVFCPFWLGNVLRATTACTFSTSQLPKVVRAWCVLSILTWKCASRHNTTACTFSTSQLPKVVRSWGVLYILTWKCASRHNGVHFFDIATSKSGPELRCFVHFDLEMCFAPQWRALFRHRNFQKWSGADVFCTFWLGNVLRATTACTFSTSQLPKVVRSSSVLSILTWKCASRHNTTACTFSTSQLPKVVRAWCVLYILTWKCASRHNGVHFFDIATSKSGPELRCFVHFDLEMCFAPQWRALFRHRNFQKWSGADVFCTFWLGNVLRATTACTFSTSQLPKVVRSSSVLSILTWKCASRHNGVHFFMSHLASWLRTRRFSEPTFRPSGATNHWKNTVNRDFPIFSRIYLFFLLILSLLTLLTSAFQLSILSEVSLLNFLR